MSTVYGVGINDADYQVSTKGWRCPFYKTWKNMLARCYSKAFQKKQPRYRGCTVDPRWHSFMDFKVWMEAQDWEGKQLDKDRHVHGNRLYGPDTCLFLSRQDNMASRECTVYAVYKGFWVHLKHFCNGDIALHSYLYNRVKNGNLNIEEHLIEREYATAGYWVTWNDEERTLQSICEEYGRSYDQVINRKKDWKNSSLYACVIYDQAVKPVRHELTGVGGVIYQFTGVSDIAEYLGESTYNVSTCLKENMSLQELRSAIEVYKNEDSKPHDQRKLYEINNVKKYRLEWIEHFETSENRVSVNMTKLKIPFVDAVQLPIIRVNYLLVNGNRMRVKEMWELMGVNAKGANKRKSERKMSFKETLLSYGVDVSNLTITAL